MTRWNSASRDRSRSPRRRDVGPDDDRRGASLSIGIGDHVGRVVSKSDHRASDMSDGRLRGGGGGGGEGQKRRLFVSNLPYEMNWKGLKDWIMEISGEDTFSDVAMMPDGRSSGIGILELRSNQAASNVIDKCNKVELNNRRVIVREMTARDHERWQEAKASASGGGGKRAPPSRSGGGGGGDYELPSRDLNSFTTAAASFNIPGIVKALGIVPPLTKTVFVANASYDLDEKKAREVFSLAGTITNIEMKYDGSGGFRGIMAVTYATELEALQAVSMFNQCILNERKIAVRMDKYEQREAGRSQGFPAGLENLGPGLAPDGSALKNIGILTELPTLLSLNGQSQGVVAPPPPQQQMNLTSALSTLSSITNALGANMNTASGPGIGGNFPAPGSLLDRSFESRDQGFGNGSQYGGPPPSNYGGQSDFGGNTYGGTSNPGSAFASSYGPATGFSMPQPVGAPQYGSYPSSSPQLNVAPQQGNDQASVIVRNLPFSVKSQQLSERFNDVGEVRVCDVKSDRSGKSMGWGLISFWTPDVAKKAVRLLDGARFEGRQMEVKLAA